MSEGLGFLADMVASGDGLPAAVIAASTAIQNEAAALGYTISDTANLESWLSTVHATDPTALDGIAVLTQPSTSLEFMIRLRSVSAAQKVHAWWNEGAATDDEYTLATGTDTNVAHTYGSGANRAVVIIGAQRVAEIREGTTNTNTSWGGTLEGFSAATYALVGRANTLSGTTAGLPPGMTFLSYTGLSALSGGAAGLPSGLTSLAIGGATTITGDVADLPSGLTTLSIFGANTLSGSTAGLPTGLTSLVVQGFNTLSGSTADLPSGLAAITITGANTISASATNWYTGTNMATIRLDSALTATEVDDLLIAAASMNWGPGSPSGTIDLRFGGNAPRTSASDAAVATLATKNVTVLTA